MTPGRRALVALWILALVVAVGYAVEAYRFEEHALRWEAAPVASLEEAGEAAAGDTWPSEPVRVTDGPVARVLARVAVEDTVGDPDVVRVTLVAPNGTRYEGDDEVVVDVTPDPGVVLVLAPSDSSARALAPPPGAPDAGVGEWRVEVDVLAAPGGNVGGQAIPTQPDGVAHFDVRVEVTAWRMA